jgi:rfaE bifunctional protein kinase chain/domain
LTKNNITLVYGNFNLLHPGLLRFLKYSKDLGYPLYVAIKPDSDKEVFISSSHRLEALNSLIFISKSFVFNGDISSLIKKIRPKYIVKGNEYKEKLNSEIDSIKSCGATLIFSSGDSHFSSSDLLKNYNFSNVNNILEKSSSFIKRHRVDLSKIRKKLYDFRKLKITVVGDLIVDEYISCEALGMSQEDPTLVVSPSNYKKFIGGAGIVAMHAKSMGVDVNYFSVTGNDSAAKFASKVLSSSGVKFFNEIDLSRPTILKQRYRAKGKTLLRVNHLKDHTITSDLEKKFVKNIISNLKKCDLLIFSDFNYGLLTNTLVDKLTRYCYQHKIPFVADSQVSSQYGDISKYKNALLLTPTELEARTSLSNFNSGLMQIVEELHSKTKPRHLFITLGSDGLLAYSPNKNKKIISCDQIGALNENPRDVSGAGDSVLIFASLGLVSGLTVWESALLASIAAYIQVSNLGNKPLTISELESVLLA